MDQSAKAEYTKNRICKEALQLFLTNGYDNISLKQVADSSQLSKGALTHHFSSKQVLLKETVSYLFSSLHELSSSKTNSDLTLKELIQYMVQQVTTINNTLTQITGVSDTGMNYHRLFLDCKRVLPDFDMVNMYFKAPIASFKHMIKQAIDSNMISDRINPDHLAFQILAIIEGSYILQFYLPGVNIENKLSDLVSTLWEGLSP